MTHAFPPRRPSDRWLLPRIVGRARASIMTLTGDAINAATALEFGLVTEVVEPETCLDRALDIADRIAANPGHSTRLAKRLLREGQDMKLDRKSTRLNSSH